MRAFVYPEGEYTGGVVTPEYVSYANMRRFWLTRYLQPGRYRVEIFNNWDNRYGNPDRVEVFIHAKT